MATKNQTAAPISLAQHNGNCFTCVNRGIMYCETQPECLRNMTSLICTTDQILEYIGSRSPFPDIFKCDSLNKSGDENLTLDLPGKFTPCYLA